MTAGQSLREYTKRSPVVAGSSGLSSLSVVDGASPRETSGSTLQDVRAENHRTDFCRGPSPLTPAPGSLPATTWLSL
jgi:hypothetical protein